MARRRPVLTSLIGGRAAATFPVEHWGRRFLHAKAGRGTTSMLERELLGFDVDSLVARYPDRIGVWFRTLEGVHRETKRTPPDEALGFYHAGHTLYLHNVHTPELMAWHRRLAVELGHPEDRITLSLFAGRKSAGTRCHYDSIENFTIQLRGHKRWRLAPNEHIEAPVETHVTGSPIGRRTRAHAPRGMPERMPDGAHEVELRAGEVLYVPRGWWHETETADDSLALFVGFSVQTWAEFVVGALADRVQRDPAWRRNVITSWDDADYRKLARAELEQRLADLARQASELTIGELAPELATRRTNGRDELRRNPLASLELARNGRATIAAVVRVQRAVQQLDARLTMDARFAPVLEVLAQCTAISAPALAKQFPRLGEAALADLLRSLVDVGYLVAPE